MWISGELHDFRKDRIPYSFIGDFEKGQGKMKYAKNTVYVTGTSKLSKSDPILSNYEIFFIGLVIDTDSDVILDSTCNMVKETTENFIKSILEGYNIFNDMESLEEEIKRRFHGMAQKSIAAAVKDARNKYLLTKQNFSEKS